MAGDQQFTDSDWGWSTMKWHFTRNLWDKKASTIETWNMKLSGFIEEKWGFRKQKSGISPLTSHWTYLNMGVSLTNMLILGWVNTNIKYVYLGNVGFCSPSYERLKMAFRLWWISSGWDLTSQWPGVDAAEGYDLGRGWIDHEDATWCETRGTDCNAHHSLTSGKMMALHVKVSQSLRGAAGTLRKGMGTETPRSNDGILSWQLTIDLGPLLIFH